MANVKVTVSPTTAITLRCEGKLVSLLNFMDIVVTGDSDAITLWMQEDLPVKVPGTVKNEGINYLTKLFMYMDILNIVLFIEKYCIEKGEFDYMDYIPALLTTYAQGKTELKDYIDEKIEDSATLNDVRKKVLFHYSLLQTHMRCYCEDYYTKEDAAIVAKMLKGAGVGITAYPRLKNIDVSSIDFTHRIQMEAMGNIKHHFELEDLVEIFDLVKVHDKEKFHLIIGPTYTDVDLCIQVKDECRHVFETICEKHYANVRETNYTFKELL